MKELLALVYMFLLSAYRTERHVICFIQLCAAKKYTLLGDLQTESKIQLNFVDFPLLCMSADSHVAFWLIVKTVSCLGQIEALV